MAGLLVRIFEKQQGGQVGFVEIALDGGWCTLFEGTRGGSSRTQKKYFSASAREEGVASLVADFQRDGFCEVGAASAAPAAVDVLITALLDAVEREIPALAERVLQLAAVDSVVALLAPPQAAQVRRVALQILVELKAVDQLTTVAALLDDADADVRIAALVALAALGGREAGADLRRAARDPEPRVRLAARASLERVGVSVVLPEEAHQTQELLARIRKGEGLTQLAGSDVNAVGWGGVTPLLLACAAGPLATVDLLLGAGAGTAARDDQGDGVLAYATSWLGPHEEVAARVLGERTLIIERLLSLGLDASAPNARGRTALAAAAAHLDRRCLELLAASCPTAASATWQEALSAAITGGNLDTVSALLDRGARASDELIELAEEEHHAAIAAELRRRSGRTSAAHDRPLEALLALAARLGTEAQSSAASSGDLDHYEAKEDLDPNDLVDEYWDARYQDLVVEAMAAMPKTAQDALPPTKALLEQLYEVYAAAFRVG